MKKAKIRNRYNQVPHLTKIAVRESFKNTRKHHIQESQEVSPFPACDYKAARHRQDNMTKTNTNIKDPLKKYRLGTIGKKITGRLQLVSRYRPHP